MRNHDKAYWDKYYKFWDEFVGFWFRSMKSDKNIAEQAAMQFGKASCINLDELPEPYYGKPHEDVDAVFINLNPGMSTGYKLESTKFFSKLAAPSPEGRLLKEFARLGSYRKYADEWSCLDPELRKCKDEHEVCGVKWWQDLAPKPIGGRMSWVRRIYNKADMCPSRVFALELCPFHSKQWEFDFADDKNLKDFICEHVIEPAVTATIENDLPFAIAIGASVRDVLSYVGAVEEDESKKWSCNSKHHKRKLNDEKLSTTWPHPKGKHIVRNYRLYRVHGGKGTARILVTWAAGGNTCPQADFYNLEQHIRQYVSNHPIGGIVDVSDGKMC